LRGVAGARPAVGNLLDIGLCDITVSRMLPPGVPVQRFELHGVLGGEVVDVQTAATLDFGAGRWSQCHCGFFGTGDNRFRGLGKRGHITIHGGFWEANAATLQRDGQPARAAREPSRVNGFEDEIEEAMRCVHAGLIESPRLPHAESLAVIEWIDAMRTRLGVVYRFE